MLLRPGARFALARELQSERGAPLGDVFTFTSGLYFRGKQAYARRFARAPRGQPGALVIVPGEGLLTLDTLVNAARIESFGQVPVDPRDPRYRLPLERAARELDTQLSPESEIVLLGSVASGKYTRILLDVFGERLLFPSEFVGRGDMSRGGLMLRAVASGEELAYRPVKGAVLKGTRPARLPKLRGVLASAEDALRRIERK